MERGRYAELEKRNRELEESVPKEKKRLQSLFTKQLKEAERDYRYNRNRLFVKVPLREIFVISLIP